MATTLAAPASATEIDYTANFYTLQFTLRRIKCLGYSIFAYQSDRVAVVTVCRQVKDSNNELKDVEVGCNRWIPLGVTWLASPTAVGEIIYQMVVELARHEVNEQFKIDGIRYINPHPEIELERKLNAAK